MYGLFLSFDIYVFRYVFICSLVRYFCLSVFRCFVFLYVFSVVLY